MRSAPTIAFEYRPSRALAALIVVLTALALLAIAMSGLPWPWKSAWRIACLAYGATSLWRHVHPRVRALAWQGGNDVALTLAGRGSGETMQGSLVDARVLGSLIVLSLRWPKRRAALWLLPDNLDADTRRRLRARLALGGIRASVNADSL